MILYTSISILTAILLSGCGSSPSSTESSSVVPGNNSTPQTAYIAYSPTVTQRIDKLYKTDGTPANTLEVANTVLPTTTVDYSKIEAFTTYGSYLYMDHVEGLGDLLQSAKSTIIKMDLGSETVSLTSLTVTATQNKNSQVKHITSFGMYTLKQQPAPNAIGLRDIVKVTSNGTEISVNNSTGFYPHMFSFSAQMNDLIFFGAGDGSGVYTILQLDTSTDTLSMLPSLPTNFFVTGMIGYNGILYIGGSDSLNTLSNNLITYDPSTTSITPIANYGSDMPSDFYAFNGRIYYLASQTVGDEGLYSIDPANPSTAPIRHGTVPSAPFHGYTVYNGTLYCVSQNQLYKIGNTPNSVSPVLPNTLDDGIIYTANNKLYFAARDIANGLELWQYDGTTASMVLDINPGAGDSTPRHITELNGNIVFQATPDGVINKLYTWDGTTLTVLY